MKLRQKVNMMRCLNFKKVFKALTSLALGLTTGLSLHSLPVDALTTENISKYSVGMFTSGYNVNMQGYSEAVPPDRIYICPNSDHDHYHKGEGAEIIRDCGSSHMVFCIDIKHGIPRAGEMYTEVKSSPEQFKARTIGFLARDYFDNNKQKASEAYI